MDIRIQIHPPSQPNRISGNIAPGPRIIKPVPIIMQSSLAIKILPRKTKVVGDGAQLHLRHAIRQIGGLPDHGAVRFDQLLGRAEVVVEEVIGAGVGFVLEQGQGLAAQVEVIAQRGAVSQGLGNQQVVHVVVVMDGPVAHGLADAAVL